MEILKRHALENIWCEPNQDSQNIFQVDRITPQRGVLNKTPVMWGAVTLPKQSYGNRFFYHVYQIGKLSNIVLNIRMTVNTWYSATEICNLNKEVIDAYFENGCMIPRDLVYLMMLPNGNFIMAIEIVPAIDFGTEDVTHEETGAMYNRRIILDYHNPIIRFYNNGRFVTPEFIASGANTAQPIKAIGKQLNTLNDYNTFTSEKQKIKTMMNNIGKYLYWIDGYIVNEPKAYSTGFMGQHHYYIWDSSIKLIDFVPVKDLISFTSKVDVNVRKYACVLNTAYNTIDYQDDVDFYLVNKQGSAYKGVIVPRNLVKNVRQLTHNAYSISSDVLQALSNAHPFLKDFTNCQLMVIVRQGGFKRGLIHQSNRINELYRLGRAEVLEAMAGVNSLVPEWEAANLESSSYATIMRSKIKEITLPMLKSAYGYNAANLYMEKASHDVKNMDLPTSVTLGLGFTISDVFGFGHRAVFCYDENGLLKDYYQDNETTETLLIKKELASTTKHVEVYHADIADSDNVIYTNQQFASPDLKDWGFRVYAVPINAAKEVIGDWMDITGGKYYDYYPDGYKGNGVPTIVWNNSLLNQYKLYPAIKLNKYVTCQKFKVSALNQYRGYHYATVNTIKSFDGVDKSATPTIAPGQLDVFLNGHSLIEGIDYFLDWPTIYICKVSDKRDQPLEDEIMVRMRGFCDKDTMLPNNFRDIGFLKGSIASVDGEFDIRNDRNSRIIIGGKVYSREKVAFAEETKETSTIQDGLPFAVSDHWGSVETYLNVNSLDYKAESLAIDKRVEAYLTPRVKTTIPEYNFIVVERWEVISPFLSSILNDIKTFGFLSNPSDIKLGAFNKAEIEVTLANYMHLLKVDPCVRNPNGDYLLFLPHQYSNTISVTQAQYALLQYLIDEYLNNMVDLTPYLTIG